MSRDRSIWLLVLVPVLVIALGLALRARPEHRGEPRAAVDAAAESKRTTASPAALAAREAQVAALVAERNRISAGQTRAFVEAGWQIVDDSPAPDPRLLAFDPSLLDGREDELATQLASTTASPDKASQIADIARRARDARTRMAAVEALGRVRGAAAQEELLSLLTDGTLDPQDPARGQIPALVRPVDLDDPMALTLAGLLDSPRLGEVDKKQIAFTLALVGLRDGMTLPGQALASLSPGARELLDQMTATALDAAHAFSTDKGAL